MKRWAACLLAVILLLTGIQVSADEDPVQSNADIQESMITREEETSGTMAENILLLHELLENEDVRSLLQIQDVRDLMTEVVGKTLIWMYENRPVTMKILAELGVTEEDRHSISMLWDSTERISEAWKNYSGTDDGAQLAEEIRALMNDPEISESWNQLMELAASEEVPTVLESIRDIAAEGSTEDIPEGILVQEAAARQLDSSTLTGRLLLRFLGSAERSQRTMEALPDLIWNENLWRVLEHLANNHEMEQVYQKEIQILTEDPGMVEFVQRTVRDAAAVIRMLYQGASVPEEQNKENDIAQ